MKDAVKSLLHSTGMVDVSVVRRLAGQLSWASGMFKWLRSFNRHLWAALASHDHQLVHRRTHHRPVWMFPVKRIVHALRWVDVALDGIGHCATTGVQRSLKLRICPIVWTLQTDACPSGMGAILYRYDKPFEFFAAEFTELDHMTLGVAKGCSS
eukprot:1211578-Amphidinium_carterae.1